MFVKEGISEPQPVASMPGVVQHTRDSLRKAAAEAVAAGVGGLVLFGVPAVKDARGSAADDPDGILALALRDLAAEVGDATVLMADLCLDEYTDHGHCGVLTGSGEVDNDATLERYGSIAVAQAAAGAHVVAPSGMMDGQVGAIRAALDAGGYPDVAICAYSAKFASAFYGPFRDAAECAPQFGDRASYQQDPRSADALREVALDLAEGADIVMVKPALAYLDVITQVAAVSPVPVAAYQVSGEYAMVEAAAANGWLDRDRVIDETVTAIRRAGASIILTYWAAEAGPAAGLSHCAFGNMSASAGPVACAQRTGPVIICKESMPRSALAAGERGQPGAARGVGALNGRTGTAPEPAQGERAAGRRGRRLRRPWAGRWRSVRTPAATRGARAGPAPVTGSAARPRRRIPCRRPGRSRPPAIRARPGSGGRTIPRRT